MYVSQREVLLRSTCGDQEEGEREHRNRSSSRSRGPFLAARPAKKGPRLREGDHHIVFREGDHHVVHGTLLLIFATVRFRFLIVVDNSLSVCPSDTSNP